MDNAYGACFVKLWKAHIKHILKVYFWGNIREFKTPIKQQVKCLRNIKHYWYFVSCYILFRWTVSSKGLTIHNCSCPVYRVIIYSAIWLSYAARSHEINVAVLWSLPTISSFYTSNGQGSLTSRKEALSFSTERISTSYCSRELTHAVSLDKGTDMITVMVSNLISRFKDIRQNSWCKPEVLESQNLS